MNKIKKIVILLMSITAMTFMIGICSYAETNDTGATKEEMLQYMKEIGTCQEYLDIIPDEKLAELYDRFKDKNVKFSGFSSEIYTFNCGDSQAEIVPYGQISDSKLQLSVATYENYDEDSKYVYALEVETCAKWLSFPLVRFTDSMTFNWDQSLFTMQGFYGESGFIRASGEYYQIDFVSSPAHAETGGVGWSLKTAPPSSVSLINPSILTSSILLMPKIAYTPASHLRTQMFFEYAHQTISSNISFSTHTIIDGSIGVGFSGGSYDTMSKVYNYRWYN